MRRALDILIATAVLLVASPLLALGAAGVALSDPGPILYRAPRVGRGGAPFAMFKFRTMRVHDRGAAITAPGDSRIFPFGAFLRRTKIDELPQFWNVIRGEMAIVGPRPEDPRIVDAHYTAWMLETLRVRPGITSPAALWTYTHGDALLDPADPEGSYAARQLPVKLAIDRAYLDRRSLGYDLRVILRTAVTILRLAAGRPGAPPRELAWAEPWLSREVGQPR